MINRLNVLTALKPAALKVETAAAQASNGFLS